MHLYSRRSLTENYIYLAQNKIKLTEKEMLVYVQNKKEKETTRLYNGRKKDDNSQVKDEEKKSP